MTLPTLYVIAGTNGIGKTTATFNLIPKNIPVINSDEIAKLAKLSGLVSVNTQEYSNREAMVLIDENLRQRISFGIETNLCDTDTWKFLANVKKSGYQIHLLFLSTDNLELLNKRIEERAMRGEHFVYPNIVQERYENGLKLLQHFFDVPDKIQLIDNSDYPIIYAQKSDGKIEIIHKPIPKWIAAILGTITQDQNRQPSAKDMSSKNDVREFYKSRLKKKP